MKKKRIILAVLIFLALVLLSSCAGKEKMKHEEMAGSRRDWSREDAPKVIKSKEIESFECEFTYGDREKEGYDYCSFKLERVDDAARCRMTGYDGWYTIFDLDFTLPQTALEDLQSLSEEHDLARYNGKDLFTNGLPDRLGTQLHVLYKSGERLYAYDNSSSILDYRAEIAIHDFFQDLAQQNGYSLSPADKD